MILDKNELFKPLYQEKQNILLIIEDSEQDYEMFMRGVKKSAIDCNVFHCETGDEGFDFLTNQGEYDDKEKYYLPTLILLDLNLPGTDGKTILKKIKKNRSLSFIPIVIFSTSSNPKDIAECYENGANGYVIKPMNIKKLQEYIEILLKHWLKVNVSYSKILKDIKSITITK